MRALESRNNSEIEAEEELEEFSYNLKYSDFKSRNFDLYFKKASNVAEKCAKYCKFGESYSEWSNPQYADLAFACSCVGLTERYIDPCEDLLPVFKSVYAHNLKDGDKLIVDICDGLQSVELLNGTW